MTDIPQGNISSKHREILCKICTPFADEITLIGLFGSRATGHAKINSDIDIVLFGDITEKMLNRIWTLCAESNSELHFDIVAYNLITHAPLKQHIDQVMIPIVTQKDLQSALSNANV